MVVFNFSKDYVNWSTTIEGVDPRLFIVDGSYDVRIGYNLTEKPRTSYFSFDLVADNDFITEFLEYKYIQVIKDDVVTFSGILSGDNIKTIETLETQVISLKYNHLLSLVENLGLNYRCEFDVSDGKYLLNSDDISNSIMHILFNMVLSETSIPFVFNPDINILTIPAHLTFEEDEKIWQIFNDILFEFGYTLMIDNLNIIVFPVSVDVETGTELLDVGADIKVTKKDVSTDVPQIRYGTSLIDRNVELVNEYAGTFIFTATNTHDMKKNIRKETEDLKFVSMGNYSPAPTVPNTERKFLPNYRVSIKMITSTSNLAFGFRFKVRGDVFYKKFEYYNSDAVNVDEVYNARYINTEAQAKNYVKSILARKEFESEQWEFFSKVSLNVGDVIRIKDIENSTCRIFEKQDNLDDGYTYRAFPYTGTDPSFEVVEKENIEVDSPTLSYLYISTDENFIAHNGVFEKDVYRIYINTDYKYFAPTCKINDESYEVLYEDESGRYYVEYTPVNFDAIIIEAKAKEFESSTSITPMNILDGQDGLPSKALSVNFIPNLVYCLRDETSNAKVDVKLQSSNIPEGEVAEVITANSSDVEYMKGDKVYPLLVGRDSVEIRNIGLPDEITNNVPSWLGISATLSETQDIRKDKEYLNSFLKITSTESVYLNTLQIYGGNTNGSAVYLISVKYIREQGTEFNVDISTFYDFSQLSDCKKVYVFAYFSNEDIGKTVNIELTSTDINLTNTYTNNGDSLLEILASQGITTDEQIKAWCDTLPYISPSEPLVLGREQIIESLDIKENGLLSYTDMLGIESEEVSITDTICQFDNGVGYATVTVLPSATLQEGDTVELEQCQGDYGKLMSRLDLESSELFYDLDGVLTSNTITLNYSPNTRYAFYDYNLNKFKPNTDYTIVFNLIENTLDNIFYLNGTYSTAIFSEDITISPTLSLGNHKYKLTTSNDLISSLIVLRSFISSNVTQGHIKYQFYILEGDWTNRELPNFLDWNDYYKNQYTLTVNEPMRIPLLPNTNTFFLDVDNEFTVDYIASNSLSSWLSAYVPFVSSATLGDLLNIKNLTITATHEDLVSTDVLTYEYGNYETINFGMFTYPTIPVSRILLGDSYVKKVIDGDVENYYVMVYNGEDWVEQTSVNSENANAFASSRDIILANENNNVPSTSSALYGYFGAISAQSGVIDNLFTQNLTLNDGGELKSANYVESEDISLARGYKLTEDKAILHDVKVTGDIDTGGLITDGLVDVISKAIYPNFQDTLESVAVSGGYSFENVYNYLNSITYSGDLVDVNGVRLDSFRKSEIISGFCECTGSFYVNDTIYDLKCIIIDKPYEITLCFTFDPDMLQGFTFTESAIKFNTFKIKIVDLVLYPTQERRTLVTDLLPTYTKNKPIETHITNIGSEHYPFSNAFVQNINASGTITVPNFNLGTKSKASSGYTDLPNGFILQWGYHLKNSSGTEYIDLDRPFPNRILNVVASPSVNGARAYFQVWTNSNSRIGIWSNESNNDFFWVSIGY